MLHSEGVPTSPGAEARPRLRGHHADRSAISRLARIRRLSLFVADSPGDQVGEQLPKPVHSGRKMVGTGQVDIASLPAAVIVWARIGPL